MVVDYIHFNWRRTFLTLFEPILFMFNYLFYLLHGSVGNFVESEETFESYVERMELYIDANGITDDKKVATFLTLAGSNTYQFAKSLLSPI